MSIVSMLRRRMPFAAVLVAALLTLAATGAAQAQQFVVPSFTPITVTGLSGLASPSSATASRTVLQLVGGSTSVTLTNVTPQIAYQAGQATGWLTATGSLNGGYSAGSSGTVNISASPAGLSAGTYNATVTVSVTQANVVSGPNPLSGLPLTITVPVTFNVTAAQAALAVPATIAPVALTGVSGLVQGSTSSTSRTVLTAPSTNNTSVTLGALTAGVIYAPGQPTGWLTANASGVSGGYGPGSSGSITVTSQAGTLPPGTYNATVSLTVTQANVTSGPTSVGGLPATATFPVQLTVTGASASLEPRTITPLTLTAVGGVTPANTVFGNRPVLGVTSASTTTVSLNAVPLTITYDAGQPTGWITQANLSTGAGPGGAFSVNVTASTAGLTPGSTVNATITGTVTQANLTGGPLATGGLPASFSLPVAFTVTGANVAAQGAVIDTVRLAGQAFVTGNAVSASPIVVRAPSTNTSTFNVTSAVPLTITYEPGQPTGWLTTTQNLAGNYGAGSQGSVTVTAQASALPAGRYTATVTGTLLASNVTSPAGSVSGLPVSISVPVVYTVGGAAATLESTSPATAALTSANPSLAVGVVRLSASSTTNVTLSGVTAQVIYPAGAPTGWLSAGSSVNRSYTPGIIGNVTASANLSGLSPGVYNATVRTVVLQSNVSAGPPNVAGLPLTVDLPVQLTVSTPAVSITTQALPGAIVGVPYSLTFGATGGTGSFTWSLQDGALPPGITLSSAGVLSGTPTSGGTFFPTIRVTSGSEFADRQYAFGVTVPVLAVSTVSLPDGTQGLPYSATLAATGGIAAYSWAVQSGALPAGVTLSPDGTLSGTPTVNGSFTVTVRVTSAAQTADRTFTFAIAAPTLAISTTTLPDGQQGTAYNASLTATGGTGAFSWTVTAGALPAGVTLSSGGVLSGNPTAFGTSTFTASVTSGAQTVARQFTIAIAPPPLAITTTTLTAGTVGLTYNALLAATGGTGAYAWTITAGALPAGLTLNSGGTITGTPTAFGSSTFTASVTSGTQTLAREFTLVVNPPALAITTTAVPAGTAGVPYNTALVASGGTNVFSWSVSAGALPAGLTLSTSGVIAGTPSAAGSSTFTATVTSGAQSQAREFTLVINPPSLAISTTTLPAGTQGLAYTAALVATGGTGTFSWAVTAGVLPAGLTLASSGAISGAPTAFGSSTFTATVTSGAQTLAREFTIVINPPALAITTPAALPPGAVGITYTTSLVATGGTGSFSWAVTTGTLPAGLTLATSGAITGTPSTAGSSTFTATVTSGAQTLAREFTIVINPPALAITTTTLPAGTQGVAYSAGLVATGGTGSFSWAVTTGALPAGLTLATSGAITGAPTTAGTSTFTATVTSGAQTQAREFTIVINPPALAITTTTLPAGAQGIAYTANLVATGGTGTFSWAVTTGALPAGLTLATSGAITGIPTAAGTTTFTATVTSGAQTLAREFTIVINPPGLAITTTTLAAGTQGVAYSATLAATGGTGTFSWAVTTGTLPAGLTLATSGAITGTPSAAGSSTFTATVTSGAQTLAREFTIVINPPALAITTTTLPAGAQGIAYSANLVATGGTGTFSWAVTTGTLPAGLTLATSGAITGTPSAAGSSTFTATVTSGAQTQAREFTIVINPPALTIVTTTLPAGTQGIAYSATLAATGGTGSFSWAVTTGALPAGLTLATSGAITGIPTAAGTSTFTATVTSGAQTLAREFTIVINAPTLAISTTTLPAGTQGQSYTAALVATGGTGTFSWAVTTGALPAGLMLGTTGTITGTPTAAGTSTFTATVTSGAQTAAREFTITIAPMQTGQPVIALSAARLEYTGLTFGRAGAPLLRAEVQVSNTGSGTLEGLAVSQIRYTTGAPGWLNAALLGTTAPTSLKVQPTTVGTLPGGYLAEVEVMGTGVTSPARLTVSMQVTDVIQAIQALKRPAALTDAERQLLDGLGNKNGRYDLGDFLALLRRAAGQPVSSALVAAVMRGEPGAIETLQQQVTPASPKVEQE